ncbi:hypothetical protein [Butyrivibrio sp.]|uniref:hypothetical protein n=1 Tax=Butyrivibrio sp. TaxID=28121 RepID=UPI0025C20578|nr:hypothetical protein [Butyrivibrio sp.]MBQ7428385.1 hypothetical protein [Butyrivibrio sp.]MBQ9303316.1 hypothetical protein [Butyrivibrio sp.]
MGRKGYIHIFEMALKKRIQVVKQHYKVAGKNLKDPDIIQQIREEAYNYFLGDQFATDCDTHEEWLRITVGRMLLEEGTPYRVIQLIKNDAAIDNKRSSVDAEIISIMEQFIKCEYSRYSVDDDIKPFVAEVIIQLRKENDVYNDADFDGGCILMSGSYGYKKYAYKIIELSRELKLKAEGYVQTIISVAVDGRIDVPVWVKPDMSHDEIRKLAKEAAQDADISTIDVIGMNPVNASFDDDAMDFDF